MKLLERLLLLDRVEVISNQDSVLQWSLYRVAVIVIVVLKGVPHCVSQDFSTTQRVRCYLALSGSQ
jgi:hypothetical protein